jgi:hypothetical protein
MLAFNGVSLVTEGLGFDVFCIYNRLCDKWGVIGND